MRSLFLVLIAAGSIANANPVPYGDDVTDGDLDLAAADVPGSNYPSSNYGDNTNLPKDTYNTEKVSYNTEEQPVNPNTDTGEISYNTGNNINPEYQPTDTSNSFELAGTPQQHPAFINPAGDNTINTWVAGGIVGAVLLLTSGFKSISRAVLNPHYAQDSVAQKIQKLCDGDYPYPVCSADINHPSKDSIQVTGSTQDQVLYKSVSKAYLIGDTHCGEGTQQTPIWPMCCQGFHKNRQAALGAPADNCYVVELNPFQSCVAGTVIDPNNKGGN